MNNSFALVTGLHWVAVLFYVAAAFCALAGNSFKLERLDRLAPRLAMPGLLIHGAGLLVWWRIVGHGPYMGRFEVLSSNAWVLLTVYLLFSHFYQKLRIAGIIVYPAAFILIAAGLFCQPEIKTLPPTFRSIWLVLHILFYKIAFASILIAFAFSLFYLLRNRNRLQNFTRLPDLNTIDLIAYRFTGFGFAFWAIGMLAGSIWAYQSWNIFWNWDPVQTWSLITWVVFGLYLHLRRFFNWQGEKAAWLFLVCFALALLSLFFTPLIESSIHAEYFK
jgi:cytochrome c-type biogenesis protein CcsB